MRQLIKILSLFFLVVLYSDSLVKSDNYTWAKSSKEPFDQDNYKVEQYIKTTVPSLQVYFSIKRYCKMYNVPEKYAFKVAFIESGWKEPFQIGYNPHDKISSANALGAMQVLLSTARDVWQDKSITEEQLLYDVDFNVHTAIKYMKQLYTEQQDWAKVYAVYNTGYNHLNEYALSVVNHGKQ